MSRFRISEKGDMTASNFPQGHSSALSFLGPTSLAGDGQYEESTEVANGIIVDHTEQGDVFAVEILDASEKIKRQLLNPQAE